MLNQIIKSERRVVLWFVVQLSLSNRDVQQMEKYCGALPLG
jgi:hypothetical protein